MFNDEYFIIRKPFNQFLSTIVDYYFHINIPVSKLSLTGELIIPFSVTNHTLNEAVLANIAISRISTDKITVQPKSDMVKIIGAQVQPFCLAYLTKTPIYTLPWWINTVDLFQKIATDFQDRTGRCSEPEEMFNEVEKVFLDNLLVRDLSLITNAVGRI
jgi:hypothetical protein